MTSNPDEHDYKLSMRDAADHAPRSLRELTDAALMVVNPTMSPDALQREQRGEMDRLTHIHDPDSKSDAIHRVCGATVGGVITWMTVDAAILQEHRPSRHQIHDLPNPMCPLCVSTWVART